MGQYKDRQRLAELFATEVAAYVSAHPESQKAHRKAQASLVNGV